MATISCHFQATTLINQEKVTQSAIDEIKNWSSSVQLVPELFDEFVSLMLLACDNSIDDTKNRIQMYFKCKKHSPEIFENRDIGSEELQKCLAVLTVAEMPTRTENNNVVLMIKLKDTSYSKFNLAPGCKLTFMATEMCQLSNNPPGGIIFCIDMAGVGLMHLTRIRLGILKKFIQFLEEGIAVKPVAFYYLNANYVFDKFFKLLKMFMSDELVKIVRPIPVGASMEEFCKNHIPAKCLPKEYGGDLPDFDQLSQATVQEMREKKKYFAAEEKWTKSKG